MIMNIEVIVQNRMVACPSRVMGRSPVLSRKSWAGASETRFLGQKAGAVRVAQFHRDSERAAVVALLVRGTRWR